MPEMTLQINVSGLDKPDEVANLVRDAMAMTETVTRTVIPAGYRCQTCFSGDGDHELGCEFKGVKPPEES